MTIINKIFGLIPGTFSLFGFIMNRLARLVEGISVISYTVAVSLHILLETEEGKKLKKIEETTQSIVNMYNNLAKKIEAQKAQLSAEENRLARIIKDDKNVLPLGKKDDDTPKS